MAAGAGRNADTTASQIPECILELISAGQARRYWRGFSGQPVKCRRNSRHGPIVNAVVPHGHEDAPNPGSKWLLPSTVSRQGSGGRGGRLPLSSRHHFSFPRAQALRTDSITAIPAPSRSAFRAAQSESTALMMDSAEPSRYNAIHLRSLRSKSSSCSGTQMSISS